MYMHTIDWVIVAVVFSSLVAVLFYCNKYLHSVADFLSASRCAGRYLLTTAAQISGMGAISMVALFQLYYQAGFSPLWWREMELPMILIMALSGWVIYRYRETRALTLAQFFELRYSRKFRIFAGFICFLSGILNYGIFPAVSARAVMWIIGLPETFLLFGSVFPTFAALMIIFLGSALFFCFMGGQIAIMVTDFLQGVFTNIVTLVFLIFLATYFSWDQIASTISRAAEGASMINPLNTSKTEDFTPFYFISIAILSFYGTMGWQGSQGYNAAARTPHEAKMASILSTLRNQAGYLLMFMIPICAYALMNHPDFADTAARVRESLQSIQGQNPGHTIELHKQATVLMVLVQILPAGLIGLFCTMTLALMLTTDDTYLHSWGSIFVQDVIMPFRKKPLSPAAHIRLLRISIFGVAIFGFFFSLYFNQSQRILMFFQMTGAIWAGAGACIVGGLYWRRGTAGGAWVAILTGAILGLGGTLLMQENYWLKFVDGIQFMVPSWGAYLQEHVKVFPLNGNKMSVLACVLALLSYFIVSSVQSAIRGEVFNLERLLHRGKYRLAGEHAGDDAAETVASGWRSLLAGREYTRGDKFIYYSTLFLGVFWFLFFIVVTLTNLVEGWKFSDAWWLGYWKFRVIYSFVFVLIITIWFSIGGLMELPRLFKLLREKKMNAQDDGRVVDHMNLDEGGADSEAKR
jgi:SSS family solute:Na+ symporter